MCPRKSKPNHPINKNLPDTSQEPLIAGVFAKAFAINPAASAIIRLRDGVIIDVNETWQAMFGYKREEALGRSIVSMQLWPRSEDTDWLVQELREKGFLRNQEMRLQKKSGESITVLGSAEMMVIADEALILSTWLDISDRKQAEMRLEKQREELQLILDLTPASIFYKDRENNFVRVNQAFAEIMELPKAELEGRSVFDLYPHAQAQAYWKDDQEVMASGQPKLNIVEPMQTEAGEWWMQTNKVPFRDTVGNIIGVIGLSADITDRKRAEEALREKADLLDLAYEAIIGCDQWGKINFWSPGAHEIYGWTLEEAINHVIHDFLKTRFPKPRAEIIAELAEKGRWEGELIHTRKDGREITVASRWAVKRDQSGCGVGTLEINRDITERKRAEEALAAAKQYAEQANRAKDHFLAVLSHELRTPLTPVVLGISMLQEKRDLDPKVLETLEMVRRNVEMEAQLIDDLLDVTRIARGKIELNRSSVELCTVIQRAAEVCKADIEARRLSFGVDLGPAASYWVEADVSRLQQVFWNLLKNAIKFTPHGGCVGIRCRPDGKYVIVEVSDSGIGIQPESLSPIFNAFEQAEQSHSRQFGGLGLGLAISKTLVEMHGGEIEAHSEGRGKGATFRIRLPLSVRQPEVRIPAAPPQRILRPLRILLVEDHGVTGQMIRTVLTEKGHSVEIAGDVSTALELADQIAFDLLLSDLGLPDGSGHDLIRELRIRGHKFPGIALSGYGQEDDIHRSYQAGFVAHLTKPASREALMEAVASAVAGSNGHHHPTADSPATQSYAHVFDADAALNRCFGKREMLEDMVRSFDEESTELLGRMHAALRDGEIAGIGQAAHRLRGILFYLGAQPATDAAQQVEQAAKSDDMTAIARSITGLEGQVELLRMALASKAGQRGAC